MRGCRVLIDDVPHYSCSVHTHTVRGRSVVTIEGLATPDGTSTPSTDSNRRAGVLDNCTRNAAVAARRRCIEYYGACCVARGFSFVATYGSSAEGFIHVHHLKPLSEIGGWGMSWYRRSQAESGASISIISVLGETVRGHSPYHLSATFDDASSGVHQNCSDLEPRVQFSVGFGSMRSITSTGSGPFCDSNFSPNRLLMASFSERAPFGSDAALCCAPSPPRATNTAPPGSNPKLLNTRVESHEPDNPVSSRTSSFDSPEPWRAVARRIPSWSCSGISPAGSEPGCSFVGHSRLARDLRFISCGSPDRPGGVLVSPTSIPTHSRAGLQSELHRRRALLRTARISRRLPTPPSRSNPEHRRRGLRALMSLRGPK